MTLLRLKVFIFFLFLIFYGCGTQKNPYLKNDIKINIEEYQKTAFSFQLKGNFDAAISYLLQALERAYLIDDVDKIIEIANSLGEIYLNNDNLVEASNFIFLAYDTSKVEKKNDFFTMLNLAKFWVKFYEKSNLFQYQKIINEYFTSSFSLADDDEKKSIYFNSYGKFLLKLKEYDKALEAFNKARAISEGKKNYLLLGESYYNTGRVYEERKEFEKAIESYKMALEYDKLTENISGIMADLKKLGRIYKVMNQREKATYYLNKAKKIAITINAQKQIEEIDKELIGF